MRFVAYGQRKAVAAALKPIYQAADETAALAALDEFEVQSSGRRTRTRFECSEDARERFTPFLAFPPMLRRVIYTTNAIESLNFQLRKIIKKSWPLPQRGRRRNCCGWRYATSKTNAHENERKNEAAKADRNAPPKADSWKAR